MGKNSAGFVVLKACASLGLMSMCGVIGVGTSTPVIVDLYATILAQPRLLVWCKAAPHAILSSWQPRAPRMEGQHRDRGDGWVPVAFKAQQSASFRGGGVWIHFHVVHIAIGALEQCRQRPAKKPWGIQGRPCTRPAKRSDGTDILATRPKARLDARPAPTTLTCATWKSTRTS